jgi:hypothetical protein
MSVTKTELRAYLHSSTEVEHQLKSGLVLNVIIGECAAIFELLASEDKTLLVGGNALLVLDLCLHGLYCI